jgi:hypothetical protein
VLRIKFGPKRDEVTEGVKKINNEKLNDLYSSPIIRVIKSKRMRWTGHVARMRKMLCLRILVEKLEGNRPL